MLSKKLQHCRCERSKWLLTLSGWGRTWEYVKVNNQQCMKNQFNPADLSNCSSRTVENEWHLSRSVSLSVDITLTAPTPLSQKDLLFAHPPTNYTFAGPWIHHPNILQTFADILCKHPALKSKKKKRKEHLMRQKQSLKYAELIVCLI